MTFNFETGARLGHISYNAVDNGAFIEEDQTDVCNSLIETTCGSTRTSVISMCMSGTVVQQRCDRHVESCRFLGRRPKQAMTYDTCQTGNSAVLFGFLGTSNEPRTIDNFGHARTGKERI